MHRNHKDTFENWVVGELLLVALLGSATALFLTNPSLRSTYELPEGRLVLDTAVVLAARSSPAIRRSQAATGLRFPAVRLILVFRIPSAVAREPASR